MDIHQFQVILFQGEYILVSLTWHLRYSLLLPYFSTSKVVILFPFQRWLSQVYDDWIGLLAFMHFLTRAGQPQDLQEQQMGLWNKDYSWRLSDSPKIMTTSTWTRLRSCPGRYLQEPSEQNMGKSLTAGFRKCITIYILQRRIFGVWGTHLHAPHQWHRCSLATKFVIHFLQY